MLNYCPIAYTFTNSAYTDLNNTTDPNYFETQEKPSDNILEKKADIALYEDLSGKHAPNDDTARKKEHVCNIQQKKPDNIIYEDLSGKQGSVKEPTESQIKPMYNQN